MATTMTTDIPQGTTDKDPGIIASLLWIVGLVVFQLIGIMIAWAMQAAIRLDRQVEPIHRRRPDLEPQRAETDRDGLVDELVESITVPSTHTRQGIPAHANVRIEGAWEGLPARLICETRYAGFTELRLERPDMLFDLILVDQARHDVAFLDTDEHVPGMTLVTITTCHGLLGRKEYCAQRNQCRCGTKTSQAAEH